MIKNEHPLISVVIPCYNQASYLPETLDSIISQSYINWEGIIVNDGSSDNTEEVALLYEQKDARFRYVSKKNGGLSSARNFGVNLALGDFILPLDSDDLIKPEYLSEAVEAFRRNPKLVLVYCVEYCFGLVDKLWDIPPYQGYKSLLLNNAFFCSAIFRKSDCMKIGGYDEKMRQGYEDWEFFIRLLNEDSEVYQIPAPLFYYRIKEVSMLTQASTEETHKSLECYIFTKHIDKYTSYFGTPQEMFRELKRYKEKAERYNSKWYRRLFYKYFKNSKK